MGVSVKVHTFYILTAFCSIVYANMKLVRILVGHLNARLINLPLSFKRLNHIIFQYMVILVGVVITYQTQHSKSFTEVYISLFVHVMKMSGFAGSSFINIINIRKKINILCKSY